MTFLGYLVLTVARILGFFIDIYTFIVAIAVIISWVNPDPYNPIVRFLHLATEPVFRRVRRLIPSSIFYRTRIDFSPLIVFILLIILETFVIGLLRELANSLLSK
ncbi:MAG: YggT family protein [Deltaproteobacteria bacterium]|nr:YggT family protein [Deltaproteobacteria bacterium]